MHAMMDTASMAEFMRNNRATQNNDNSSGKKRQRQCWAQEPRTPSYPVPRHSGPMHRSNLGNCCNDHMMFFPAAFLTNRLLTRSTHLDILEQNR